MSERKIEVPLNAGFCEIPELIKHGMAAQAISDIFGPDAIPSAVAYYVETYRTVDVEGWLAKLCHAAKSIPLSDLRRWIPLVPEPLRTQMCVIYASRTTTRAGLAR